MASSDKLFRQTNPKSERLAQLLACCILMQLSQALFKSLLCHKSRTNYFPGNEHKEPQTEFCSCNCIINEPTNMMFVEETRRSTAKLNYYVLCFSSQKIRWDFCLEVYRATCFELFWAVQIVILMVQKSCLDELSHRFHDKLCQILKISQFNHCLY